MDLIAILGLAVVLFVKECGVPVPVPGDLLVLGAGVASSGNPAAALAALVAILVAGYLGGGVQYAIVRGRLRPVLLRILERLGVSSDRVEALGGVLRRRGATGVAAARATPGVRVVAIAASGVAAVPAASFATGLVVGNTVFVGAHFALGYVVGVPATALIADVGPALVAGVAVLAVAGGIGWLVLRRRRGGPVRHGTLAAWTDAACPACLALAALPAPSRGLPINVAGG